MPPHSFYITAIVLVVFLQSAHAARIYSLVDYPDLQNGHTLSGTITTTDDAPDDGLLVTEEILDWEWDIDGPNVLSASLAPGSTDTFAHGISISTRTIELPFATPADLRLWQRNTGSRGGSVDALRWSVVFDNAIGVYSSNNVAGFLGGDVPTTFWLTTLSSPSNSGWVIATVIPEPGTQSLVSILVMTMLCAALTRQCATAGLSQFDSGIVLNDGSDSEPHRRMEAGQQCWCMHNTR